MEIDMFRAVASSQMSAGMFVHVPAEKLFGTSGLL